MTQLHHKEHLGHSVFVYRSETHTFGTDAFLLAHFAAPRRRERACDLGCGCGIIPLLWMREENRPKEVFGLEIQPDGVALAQKAAEESGLAESLHIVQGDIRELPPTLPRGAFDLVTCNPPYKAVGAGVMSSAASDQIARHETSCAMADVCTAAARLLRFGGRLCVCQLPERIPDVLEAMRASKIEPKRMRMVQENPHTPPWLVLVEGKLGSKPFLQVETPLYLRLEGESSPELKEIYRYYGKS